MLITEIRFIQIIGVILLFGTVMAFLAGVTLLFPGTALAEMWVVNPGAYQELLPFAKVAGIGFLILAPILAFAGYGLLHFKRWGWRLAVILIGANAVGDIVNLLRGEVLKGMVGVIIALFIVICLLSPSIKKHFATPLLDGK